jgi:hypothetical protein
MQWAASHKRTRKCDHDKNSDIGEPAVSTQSSKIAFHLETDDAGFPPMSLELINGELVADDKFRILNAPFFVQNVSYGDIVVARSSEVNGQWEFVRVMEASDFTSISIILLDSSLDETLMALLRGKMCVIEYGEFGVYRMLAVAFPVTVDYPSFREQLSGYQDRGLISFAELAICSADL